MALPNLLQTPSCLRIRLQRLFLISEWRGDRCFSSVIGICVQVVICPMAFEITTCFYEFTNKIIALQISTPISLL
jgi:hypothetical protein